MTAPVCTPLHQPASNHWRQRRQCCHTSYASTPTLRHCRRLMPHHHHLPLSPPSCQSPPTHPHSSTYMLCRTRCLASLLAPFCHITTPTHPHHPPPATSPPAATVPVSPLLPHHNPHPPHLCASAPSCYVTTRRHGPCQPLLAYHLHHPLLLSLSAPLLPHHICAPLPLWCCHIDNTEVQQSSRAARGGGWGGLPPPPKVFYFYFILFLSYTGGAWLDMCGRHNHALPLSPHLLCLAFLANVFYYCYYIYSVFCKRCIYLFII